MRSTWSWAAVSATWISRQRRVGMRVSTSLVIASPASRPDLLAPLVGDPVHGALADQDLPHLAHRVVADDADLVLLVLAEPLDVGLLDRPRALVLLDAAAREHLGADHGARDARRHAQRGVADVPGLLAEDRAQQPLLGRELRLALRRDLADQDVVGLHLGADPHDAGLVEVLERLLADVRDVAGDLLLAELGVAGDALELLDVHRGEQVVLHQTLGDQDRVLEVVPAPGHEGDEHVAPERELAALRGRPVRDHLPALHAVAELHDRLLVDAGVLVRALVLDQADDVDVRAGAVLLLRADHDAPGVHRHDLAVALGDHGHARVARHHGLHARADERRLGAQQRHGLALHVGAHQRAVRVVVLEEGDQRGGHRHQLVRRHVHHLDLFRRHHHELAGLPRRDAVQPGRRPSRRGARWPARSRAAPPPAPRGT